MALRLAPQATGGLADNVVRYGYDRASQDVGIVHFGIGAFHRAHQAWYTDLAMDGGCRDWAVTGVSLRSGDVGRQLNPQDGLYTVTERSGAGSHTRLIGAVREVLIASKDGEAVVARLAAPGTHIASLTITEKGYCRAADGSLDPALADEGSVFAFLARGLRRRQPGEDGEDQQQPPPKAPNVRTLHALSPPEVVVPPASAVKTRSRFSPVSLTPCGARG